MGTLSERELSSRRARKSYPTDVRLADMTLEQIRQALRTIQLQRKWGDRHLSISLVADTAGVHRDTIYALLSGDRICIRSQYALSKALRELSDTCEPSRTKAMHVKLGPLGPTLGFGVGKV